MGSVLVSPDGTRVIYEADREVNNVHHLDSGRSPAAPGCAADRVLDPRGRRDVLHGQGLDLLPALVAAEMHRVAPDCGPERRTALAPAGERAVCSRGEQTMASGMEQRVDARRVIGVSLLALLVLALAFVPWGELRVSERLFEGPSLGGALRMSFTPVVEIDGWHGYVMPLGVKVPNAVVVLAALAVALLCWLQRTGVWSAPAWVLVVLVAYGIGHSGRVVLALAGGDGATLGAGSVLTLGCWVGMAAVLARTRTASDPGG